MGACPKCGRRKVRKRKQDGLRRCQRCGFLRGPMNLSRTGSLPKPIVQPTELECHAAEDGQP